MSDKAVFEKHGLTPPPLYTLPALEVTQTGDHFGIPLFHVPLVCAPDQARPAQINRTLNAIHESAARVAIDHVIVAWATPPISSADGSTLNLGLRLRDGEWEQAIITPVAESAREVQRAVQEIYGVEASTNPSQIATQSISEDWHTLITS
ncbi:hypothetical protein [Halioglobus sp. HI00S01]|uniref:hypothetical protein n=1 Tax=Halioglobus sp. HI00S01 TaxID=1822214 RepID=UPI0012E77603|nr:hypothetical protein [Halioglobus sp. HI00S01]